MSKKNHDSSETFRVLIHVEDLKDGVFPKTVEELLAALAWQERYRWNLAINYMIEQHPYAIAKPFMYEYDMTNLPKKICYGFTIDCEGYGDCK